MKQIQKLVTFLTILSIFIMSLIINVSAVKSPFIVSVAAMPPKIDPADVYDKNSIDTIMQVCEGLYAYNLSSPEMEVIPRIAKNMGTWSVDKKNLTIEIRDDITFHDGTPLTAESVKWNFDRVMNFTMNKAIAPYRLYLNREGGLIVNKTVKIDNTHIRFVLNEPSGVWEQLLGFPGTYIIKPDDNYKSVLLTLEDKLIGSGPFKLGKIIEGQKVVFNRYDNYYRGPANISQMVYTYITDPETRAQTILNKEVHIGNIGSDYFQNVIDDSDLSLAYSKTNEIWFIVFNVQNIKRDIREAMSFAFNYSYFIENIRQGSNSEIRSPIPNGMLYHNESFDDIPYYNTSLARKLLIESTDPDIIAALSNANLDESNSSQEWIAVAESNSPLFEFNFTRYDSLILQALSLLFRENMKEIGIKVKDQYVGTWNDFVDLLINPITWSAMDMYYYGVGPDYNNPITMIEPNYQSDAPYNLFHLNDPKLDGLINETYEVLGQEQAQVFWEIQDYITTDLVPAVFVEQIDTNFVYNSKLVSNINDNLNNFGYRYFYNFKFNAPNIPDVPGYNIGFLIIAISIGVILIKRKQ